MKKLHEVFIGAVVGAILGYFIINTALGASVGAVSEAHLGQDM